MYLSSFFFSLLFYCFTLYSILNTHYPYSFLFPISFSSFLFYQFLERMFDRFGTVRYTSLVPRKRSFYGFVGYDRPSEAERAGREMHGFQVQVSMHIQLLRPFQAKRNYHN